MKKTSLKKPPKPYTDLKRGHTVYVNTGELSFDTRPQEAGTFPATFLEWVENEDWKEDQLYIMENRLSRENAYYPWYYRVVNHKGRIEVVNPALVSVHNV